MKKMNFLRATDFEKFMQKYKFFHNSSKRKISLISSHLI